MNFLHFRFLLFCWTPAWICKSIAFRVLCIKQKYTQIYQQPPQILIKTTVENHEWGPQMEATNGATNVDHEWGPRMEATNGDQK